MSGRRYADVAGYVIREKIGDGAFAKVHLAVDYETHQTAACKIVPITKSNMDAQALKDLKKEIKVHSQLKHRHILQFIADRTVMDDEESARLLLVPAVYMLLEYASGGDLFDKIVPDVGLSPAVAHHYFRQIISGLDYMHGKGVCHRDLKPENIMLDLNGTLKLCDFGLCAVYKHKGMERLLTERCGSLPYVAPELNGDQPYNGELIDVWGVGVILFTLLVGNTPWDEPTDASPEYAAFISGEIFDVAPWDRVKGETL
ncbi:Chk1 protein kinase, partial [Tulasnella sp. 418]